MITTDRLEKIKTDCAERVERNDLPDGEHVQFRIAAEVYVPELIEALQEALQESKKLNEAHLYDYPTGTALIRYRDRDSGKTNDWFIGAAKEKDTAETLEAHLRRFKPNAEFIGWVIK